MRAKVEQSRIDRYLEMYNGGMSLNEIALEEVKAGKHCTGEWVRRILRRSPLYVARPRKHPAKTDAEVVNVAS